MVSYLQSVSLSEGMESTDPSFGLLEGMESNGPSLDFSEGI